MFEPNTTVAPTDSADDTSSRDEPAGAVKYTARGGMGLGSGVEDGDGDGDVVGATDREPVSVAVDDGDGNTVCVEDADAEYDGDCDTDRDDVCVGDSEVVDETDGVVDTDSEADVDAVGESVADSLPDAVTVAETVAVGEPDADVAPVTVLVAELLPDELTVAAALTEAVSDTVALTDTVRDADAVPLVEGVGVPGTDAVGVTELVLVVVTVGVSETDWDGKRVPVAELDTLTLPLRDPVDVVLAVREPVTVTDRDSDADQEYVAVADAESVPEVVTDAVTESWVTVGDGDALLDADSVGVGLGDKPSTLNSTGVTAPFTKKLKLLARVHGSGASVELSLAVSLPSPHVSRSSSLGNRHCRVDAATATTGQYHLGCTSGSPSTTWHKG